MERNSLKFSFIRNYLLEALLLLAWYSRSSRKILSTSFIRCFEFSLSCSWLKKTVGKACLNFYELHIILSEVEIIIISRPLNMLYHDEMYEVMTPNHLLFGRKLYLENPNWESNSYIVEPDFPKRIE